MIRSAIATGLLFASTVAASAQSPALPDTIQGRVLTDSSIAIAGATVNVTRAPDRAFLTATTDSLGRFKIIFNDGTGDYLVHAAMVGYKSERQRLLKNADGSMPSVTLKLASAVQKLATVQVESSKPTPDRTLSLQVGTGEAGRITDGVNGIVSPDLAGNLEALALTVPGVSQVAGGISVLGMGPGANAATLNGMAFSGTSLPRDAHTTTRIATSTYDPARGGFSGAQTSVELDQGNLYSQRTAHIAFDDPALQYGGVAGSGPNQRFRNLQLSAGGNGSVNEDRTPYNYGIQGGLRGAGLSSLENASVRELSDAGVSSASATRLLQGLSSRGFPLDRSQMSATSQNLSFIGRVDRAPYDWTTFKPSKTSWGILGFGNIDNQTNSGISALTASSTARDFRKLRGGIQALYSTFITPDHLAEVKSGITLDEQRDIPNSLLPLGMVNVQTGTDGSDSTFTSVAVGGPGTIGSRSRGLIWETIASTEFYLNGKENHYIRFTANARIESRHSSTADNTLGSFFYNSIGDLESNRPSEFDRILVAPERDGSEASGFVSASDSWRVTPKLRVLYGARFEGNRFGDVPALNKNLLDAFGQRNDHAPNSLHASPRIGFTWRLNDGYTGGYSVSPLGQFRESTLRFLSGGIGEFRNSLPADLMEAAAANTGLAEASSGIRCIGSAVPIPNWSSFTNEDAIPRDCAGGDAARSVFADSAPHAELFSAGYSPTRAWRANLAYNSKVWVFSYTVAGDYSLGLSLPEYKNLNFSGSPKFTDDEGRPIFVSEDAIDPASGSVSAVESRLNHNFGSVISRESSGASRTGRLTLSVVPKLGPWKIFRGSYTLAASRATFGGFTSSTFDSPLIRETSRSDFDSRHQILLSAGTLYRGFTFTLFSRIQSGLPFTPVVSGDVNGDGSANDRAFIVDPSVSSRIANGMKALLASAPGRVKDCLERQAGKPAARNSCDGPWTSSMTAQITSLHNLPLVHQRGHAALAFSNPLGGIDRLLHGSNALHGWGSTMYPDPNLYIVRGFDPSASRFIYDVNPRFGRSRLSDAFNRTPFRVTLDISLDIGTPVPVQQVERFLMPGRNGDKRPKLTASDLKKRYQRTVNDPYRQVLEQSDSLLLSRDQSEEIATEDARYRAGMDSIWTEAAEKLAALPDLFDPKIALKLQEDASDAAWEYSRLSIRQSLGRLLSPLQIELAGGLAQTLYRADKPLKMRTYMY